MIWDRWGQVHSAIERPGLRLSATNRSRGTKPSRSAWRSIDLNVRVLNADSIESHKGWIVNADPWFEIFE